jgi:hypothetical protein
MLTEPTKAERPAIHTGRCWEFSAHPANLGAEVLSPIRKRRREHASKSAGTQRMRRGILKRFRAAYGDRLFALLPAEWIEALLDSKWPHAARSWLVTLRSLCQFAVKRRWLRTDPTAGIKLPAIGGDGFHMCSKE